MKKINDIPLNSSSIRGKSTPDKPVARQVLANGQDITKITGVDAGNQPLHDFVNRVNEATKSKSNSLTLTVNEANQILINITGLVLSNKDLQDQIFALQNQLIEERNSRQNTIVISADGGKF